MGKTIIIQFGKYLLVLVNMIELYVICSDKYKIIRNSRNKIVKFLVKSKSWNLPKSRYKNLFKFKEI